MKHPQQSLFAALAAAGLCALPLGVSAATIPVVELFHAGMNHYFITANAAEASFVDQGGAGAGWVRTGKTFAAYGSAAEAPAGAVPVCRFYGTPGIGPNSHFYTANATECESAKWNPGLTYEGIAFHIAVPNGGTCASGTGPVYRNYNQRWQQNDSNHRYTTDQAVYNQMSAAGWAAEGVVFCAADGDAPPPPPPPTAGSDCLPAYTPGDLRRFKISATGMNGAQPASPMTERVGVNTTFDGQSAVPSSWTDDAGKVSQILYQQFTPTHRLELGVDSYDLASGARTSSLKYSPALSYPLSMSAGQTHSMSFSTVDMQSGSTISSNTLAFTYAGREAVTVPAGTFGNACKYTSRTQTSAYGFTVINDVTSWTDSSMGLVKSFSTTTNFGVTTTITQELLSANVGGVAAP
jgi:hypothetical protein